jgi:hypothetical protein
MDPLSDLSIGDALESLRDQLRDAIDRAQGNDLAFICKTVEVQLQVTVTKTMKGSIKAGLWSVVTVEAGADAAKADVHLIKLILDPLVRTASGTGPVEVGDDS